MGRPRRIQASGACYHVFNRGSRRQAIFVDDVDHATFLDLIGAATDKFGLEVHAYCLMGNHYHLLVRTPGGNVAEAMHHVLATYVRRFNKRHGYDGPLFRGRYRSPVIEVETHFLGVSRYVHRNPIEAGIVHDLLDYELSSYRALVGRGHRPWWLRTDLTLAMAGGIDAYRRLVEGVLDDAELAENYALVLAGGAEVIGGAAFRDRMGLAAH